MRKFAAFLLSAALLISLTACGGAETDPQENTQAGARTDTVCPRRLNGGMPAARG